MILIIYYIWLTYYLPIAERRWVFFSNLFFFQTFSKSYKHKCETQIATSSIRTWDNDAISVCCLNLLKSSSMSRMRDKVNFLWSTPGFLYPRLVSLFRLKIQSCDLPIADVGVNSFIYTFCQVNWRYIKLKPTHLTTFCGLQEINF